MAKYTINGVDLHIPDGRMTLQIDRVMAKGQYENSEAEALLHHLRPRDRYLDIGAGAGYLMALAGRVRGVAHVAGVEADPAMAEIARANMTRNKVKAEVVTAAMVADGQDTGRVPFTVRRSFWASSLTAPEEGVKAQIIEAETATLGALLDRFRPSVCSIDVEGGEMAVAESRLNPELRLIVMEVHPSIYGKAGTRRLFDALSAAGFCYCPPGSKGTTVVFERIELPG